jgi:hypothetical protein
MRREDALRLFGLNNLLIEAEVRRLENRLDVDLGHCRPPQKNAEETFYPQFLQKLRDEAAAMAQHYATFYCLENSIRELICSRLEEAHGHGWWDVAVPAIVRENVQKNYRKEVTSGVTLRSDKMIDYSNFGELGEIIKSNWDTFGDMLRDISAVQRILGNLNTLRGPIAHCKALAEDEIVRLRLSLADWFRQMS